MSAHAIRRILVVEDVAKCLDWVLGALRLAYPAAQVITASSLAQARQKIRRPPDLALIDLDLPDGSGVELIAELSAARADCLCVVITIFDDDAHLYAALRAGAQGYLLKDQEQDDIAESLAGIVDGKPPLSPSIAKQLLESFNQAPAEVEEPLTQREMEVLTLITKGYKLSDVARACEVSRSTIAFHVKNIYRKLQVSTRAEVVSEAVRLGLSNPR